MNDLLDSRVVGGVAFVDAVTGVAITQPLQVSSPGVRFWVNRSGVFALAHVPGLEAHETAFEAPPADPLGSLTITLTVGDASGRYMPRSAQLSLPLDPDPAHDGSDGSLFETVRIPLYPSPIMPIQPGWAVVRASVTLAASGDGAAGAYLRVRDAADATKVFARGLADARGEGFVAVAGIPTVVWGTTADQPVLARDIDAVVEAYYDPASGDNPDPEKLESSRSTLATASVAIKLASGRETSAKVEVPA